MKVTIENIENGFVIKDENGKIWAVPNLHYSGPIIRSIFEKLPLEKNPLGGMKLVKKQTAPTDLPQ